MTNDYAKALAEVGQMQTDLVTANATIAQLRRDLDRSADRLELVNEERLRYREDSTIFRNKLVELATQMANIGLLTVHANEILQAVQELTMRDTKAQDQAEIKPQITTDKPAIGVDAIVTGHDEIANQIEETLAGQTALGKAEYK